eukprot:1161226-Pelagomonas_calceolata.AAC.13
MLAVALYCVQSRWTSEPCLLISASASAKEHYPTFEYVPELYAVKSVSPASFLQGPDRVCI